MEIKKLLELRKFNTLWATDWKTVVGLKKEIWKVAGSNPDRK
jgi:hypothetical protein